MWMDGYTDERTFTDILSEIGEKKSHDKQNKLRIDDWLRIKPGIVKVRPVAWTPRVSSSVLNPVKLPDHLGKMAKLSNRGKSTHLLAHPVSVVGARDTPNGSTRHPYDNAFAFVPAQTVIPLYCHANVIICQCELVPWTNFSFTSHSAVRCTSSLQQLRSNMGLFEIPDGDHWQLITLVYFVREYK